MNEIVTIGIDLAKNVFLVHGVDAAGAVVVRRKLRRSQVLTFFSSLQPCLVGMEGRRWLRHRFKRPPATPAGISGRGS